MAHTITPRPDDAAEALQITGLSVHGLAPIDLALAAGECVCISGASGCGKSLLLRAIADLDPHAGDVYCSGQACSTMSAADWRQQVALVPTESAWWADQVKDHFNTPPEPHQLETLGFPPAAMDWQVSRLSSGERQRLALLRALQCAPTVLLLDEATANLDAGHTACVELLLAAQRTRGLAILWVSHDQRQVTRVADRYYLIESGALTPQALPT